MDWLIRALREWKDNTPRNADALVVGERFLKWLLMGPEISSDCRLVDVDLLGDDGITSFG